MKKSTDSGSIEPLGSIEDVLFAARVGAINHIHIPDNIGNKYEFLINNETKQTIITKKEN